MLEQIIKALIGEDERLSVEETNDEMGVLLTIDVDKHNMGKIIGRSGNMINSIRNIIKFVGFSESSRINIKINDPYFDNKGRREDVR